MDILPKEIENIILTYKKDLELLDEIPPPYAQIASNLSYNCYHTLSPADFLVLHVVELINRIDLNHISIDQLLDYSPHECLEQFERASELQTQRLALYGLTGEQKITPLWRYSLPYILIDFLSTNDLFQLQYRLAKYFESLPQIAPLNMI